MENDCCFGQAFCGNFSSHTACVIENDDEIRKVPIQVVAYFAVVSRCHEIP